MKKMKLFHGRIFFVGTCLTLIFVSFLTTISYAKTGNEINAEVNAALALFLNK